MCGVKGCLFESVDVENALARVLRQALYRVVVRSMMPFRDTSSRQAKRQAPTLTILNIAPQRVVAGDMDSFTFSWKSPIFPGNLGKTVSRHVYLG